MSWELASFLVLGVVLVCGFAWYERTRPPSQIVALVAALAALAVAGRVLFVAIPNVVATTDVVLFAGYAVGGAPGFAVGALAGLISNFWLGQGPWTPWQMAGWGMTGVLGAALFTLTRGRAGRFTLAAACGFAALAYGALLNFSLMASYGGELTLERFLTLQARAAPFDAAHAIGNVTLALVAGPAMVRMLVRFKQRFEWKRRPSAAQSAGWRPGVAVSGLLLVALLLSAPAAAQAADVGKAARWLAEVQNDDGGFGSSPGRDSSVAMTGWAMLGLEAAKRNPLDVRSGDKTPVGYLTRQEDEINSTGDLARTILALVGAGVEPRHFAGRNLLRELRQRMRRNGSFNGWPNDTAFSIMALRAAGAPKGLKQSLRWLRKVQNGDGGWGAVPGVASDADSTGAVLQVVSGRKTSDAGLRYLRRHQRGGGGFSLGGSSAVNAQSTAWAVQGMIAAGVDPRSVRRGGASGIDYLTARQAADGHFRYSRSSDQTPVWVTGQVLVAAAEKRYPLARVPREPAPEPETGATAPTPPDYPTTSEVPSVPGYTPPTGTGGTAGVGATGGDSTGVGKVPKTPQAPTPTIPELPTAPAVPKDGAGPGGEADGKAGEAAAAEKDKGPAPAAPIGIGTGSALAAFGITLWLGRRRNW